jgi:oligopeptide/dipeptide ABC transporter, ATP-binding protein, C-terminal domain
MILGLVKPTTGQVTYNNADVSKFKGGQLSKFRQEVQPIFQNPFEAFNPLKKVDRYLRGSALNYGVAKSEQDSEAVIHEALSVVGLSSERVLGKYPHEFSGGELQRVSIARALIPRPRVLVADEPVSMLDASVKMGIVNIFLQLKQKYNMSIVYVTHDLATAYYISDEIAVMLRGTIVESGPVDEVLTKPLHPYTRLLLDCLPEPDPEKRWKEQIVLSGLEVKEFEALGCKFAKRCPYAKEACLKTRPPKVQDKDSPERYVECWKYA